MKAFNKLKACPRVPRVACQFAKLGVCITRVDRARLCQCDAERELLLDKGGTRGAS